MLLQTSIHALVTAISSKIYIKLFMEMYVVVDYPTPSEGWGMAEDHGAPEAGQPPRAWTRGRRKTKSRQKASSAESP